MGITQNGIRNYKGNDYCNFKIIIENLINKLIRLRLVICKEYKKLHNFIVTAHKFPVEK